MRVDNHQPHIEYDFLPLKDVKIINSPRVTKSRVLVGRSLNCDIVVNSPVVSAIHCLLEFKNGVLRVFDLHSSNGTYINGEKIISKEISMGAVVTLGNLDFRLQEPNDQIIPPPVLDILTPGLPPIIEKSTDVEPALPRLKKQIQSKKLPSRPIAFKEKNEEIPSVVYPLKADPKAEYSEYIFEDVEELYPIFKYDVSLSSVEVIILHKDRIFSADFIPLETGNYYLVGHKNESNESRKKENFEYPHLGKTEKMPFVTINGGEVTVDQPIGYEALYLTDDDTRRPARKTNIYNLRMGDVLCFSKGENSIFLRQTEAPPKVAKAPLFRRDPDLKKYLGMMFLLISLFLGGMHLYPIDPEIEKEKIPKTIRTIIYKPKFKIEKAKLTSSKNKAITKTKKAPKVNQKSPVQKLTEKPKVPKKKIQPKEKTNKKISKKTSGKKAAPKVKQVRKVKKAGPAKRNTVKKVSRKSRAPKIGGRRSGNPSPTKSFNKRPSPNKGRVDTYKSNVFKSTISNLLAKGGSTAGVKAASTKSASSSGFTELAEGGSEVGELQRAKVSSNLGSLTGAATGKIDTSKGAEGLVNKRTVYTAGIPSDTVVLGSMDPDIIRRILREHIPQFRYCYQKELNRASKEFSGVVKLNFIIGNSGHVTRSSVQAASSMKAEVKRCVNNVLRGIRFPEPKGGGRVEVKQPINFYPNVK